jgi:hypothetical protein
MSKERILTKENDNDNFANWVNSKSKEVWLKIFKKVKENLITDVSENEKITLFGEWCGKGIQNKAAITKCERMFFIFAIRIGNDVDHGGKPIGWLTDNNFKNVYNRSENIFNSSMFENFFLEVDWNYPKEIEKIVEEKTKVINDSCPVAEYFGVDGVGEGIVWIPANYDELNNTKLWFKTKGDKHKQNKKSKDSEIDPEIIRNISALLDEYLVENRLERGIAYLKEAGIFLEAFNTKFFIEFIAKDILKDASEHLKTLEIDSEKLRKEISKYSGKWFNKYLDNMEN